ncbi:MAG TPA: Ig-like domain-containing protein [Acidimicrobiales bacterium]|nr:Ig-like domain-containing protein [Acidimicrobiales bacterium]
MSGVLLAAGLLAQGASAATFAAEAAVDVHEQFVGDTGKVFSFSVSNTGTTDNIASVLISRPTSRWTITACPGGPAGWTVTKAQTFVDVKCRYVSAAGPADDITPGNSSSAFQVQADSAPGAENATGDWKVAVSKTTSFSGSDAVNAMAGAGQLTTTAHVWEITDVVVAQLGLGARAPCPAPNKQAFAGSSQSLIVCGRNHANVALAAGAGSSLAGTFVASPGTFMTGSDPLVTPGSAAPVVLGSWLGVTITSTPGTGHTVVATIASSATATSPVTTFTGYTATGGNVAPTLANVGSGAVTFTENGPAVAIAAPSLTLTDPDSSTVASATVQITGSYESGHDVLSFTPIGGNPVTGSFAPASGTLTLTGPATLAQMEAALEAVRFGNTSDTPSTATRTVSFRVNDGAAVNNLSNVVARDVNVVAVNDLVATNDTFSGAIGNTKLAVGVAGQTGPVVQISGNVLSNDSDADGPGPLTASLAGSNPPGGRVVTMNSDGTFVYVPPPGLKGGSDSFQYNVSDGAGTATGTVTINIQSVLVWYVDATAPVGGLGRSTDPFQNLTPLRGPSDVDGPGDIIFLYSGSYSGGLPLENNQHLFGAPHGLVVGSPPSVTLVAPNAGAANPTIQAAGPVIVLAQNNVIRRVNVGAPGSARSGAGITGTGIQNADIGSNVTITNTIGPAFELTGNAAGTIAVAASIVQGAGNGDAVVVQNRTGGSVTFSGPVSGTGEDTDIVLANNANTTTDFSAGVTLAGAGSTFSATGGGTVTVRGSNNSIGQGTPPTGPALNVVNTTIGQLGLTFKHISATGGANGIVLDNTGSLGGLTVTGSGGTGGTIQGMSGPDGSTAGVGVYLNSTKAVSLNLMDLIQNATHGIQGNNVSGFTMDSSVVRSNGTTNSPDEGNIRFTGLAGTASITDSDIRDASEYNVQVVNGGGSLNLTLDNVTVGPNHFSLGDDAVQLEATAGTFNVTVTDSTFTGARGDVFNLTVVGTASSAFVFTGNTLNNAHPNIVGGGGGMTVAVGGSGDMTYNISDNTFRGSKGTALLVSKAFGAPPGDGTLSGRIERNTIGVSGVPNSGSSEGSGIEVIELARGSHTTLIKDNQIYRYSNFGILVTVGGADEGVTGLSHDGTMSATIQGNTIAQPNAPTGGFAQNGIHLNSGTNTGDAYQVCMSIGDPTDVAKKNTLTGSGALGGTDYRLRQRMGTTVRLPGYTGPADGSGLPAYLNPRTNGAATVSWAADSNGFLNTPGGAACALPA